MADNDASPTNKNASLLYPITTNGTFTLCLYATNGSPGEYTVAARLVPGADDSDSDGLPDYWEIFHGLDPQDNGTTDPDQGAAGDPDGDGIDNAGEFEDDTSPVDPSSAFVVTAVGDTGGPSSIVVTVATEPDGVYRIQFTDMERLREYRSDRRHLGRDLRVSFGLHLPRRLHRRHLRPRSHQQPSCLPGDFGAAVRRGSCSCSGRILGPSRRRSR